MTSTLQYGLPSPAIESLRSVFKKFPTIEKVILYGSRAKGNFKPGSDIDLTLFTRESNLSFLFKVEDAIDELFLPYKVDLSIYNLLDNENLRDHIYRVGIEFYKREGLDANS
ncbi:MAG: nucleotidyltransferase domain-containing protein [Pseudobdellovibrionaceae bacterium]